MNELEFKPDIDFAEYIYSHLYSPEEWQTFGKGFIQEQDYLKDSFETIRSMLTYYGLPTDQSSLSNFAYMTNTIYVRLHGFWAGDENYDPKRDYQIGKEMDDLKVFIKEFNRQVEHYWQQVGKGLYPKEVELTITLKGANQKVILNASADSFLKVLEKNPYPVKLYMYDGKPSNAKPIVRLYQNVFSIIDKVLNSERYNVASLKVRVYVIYSILQLAELDLSYDTDDEEEYIGLQLKRAKQNGIYSAISSPNF